MGIDAKIFSKKTKTGFYFDRLYNIELKWSDESPEEIKDYCSDVYDRLTIDGSKTISLVECIKYVNILLEYKEDKNYLESILEYLNLLPEDDKVFVVPDYNDDPYGYIVRYCWENKNLWKYDKDYNRIPVTNKTIYNGKIVDISQMRNQKIDEILK